MPLKPRMNMKPYTVTRTVAGTPTAGNYAHGSSSTLPITANVQPVGDELVVVPEGRHATDVRKIFTATLLRTIETGFEPDRIAIDGETFEVYNVAGWPGHYEVLAAKQERP